MTIREAELKDCGRMDELLTELIHYESQFEHNLDPTFQVKDNYSERLKMEGHKAYVAEVDGRIAGFVYGFIYDIPGLFLQPVAIMDALYVEEKYRGLGIAGKLIAEFIRFANEQKADTVELKVLTENSRALGLYERLGFQETKKYMVLKAD